MRLAQPQPQLVSCYFKLNIEYNQSSNLPGQLHPQRELLLFCTWFHLHACQDSYCGRWDNQGASYSSYSVFIFQMRTRLLWRPGTQTYPGVLRVVWPILWNFSSIFCLAQIQLPSCTGGSSCESLSEFMKKTNFYGVYHCSEIIQLINKQLW